MSTLPAVVSEEESFSPSLFEVFDVEVQTSDRSKSVTIHGVKSKEHSDKPPLLLVHGHPQTHHIWRKVAPILAEQYQLVIPDIRGHGFSSAPNDPTDTEHELYSKRSMAQDMFLIMKHFRHSKFYVVGHDRGARISHRLAVDHPEAVIRLVLLDIAPTLAMYEKTNDKWATLYWHWFFLTQKAPMPETFIGGSPITYITSKGLGFPSAHFTSNALASYHANASTPDRLHAMCEDYRASAPGNIDLRLDAQDRQEGKKIECDLLVLFGEKGVIGKFWDVEEEWKRVCIGKVEARGVPTGHFVPEEMDTEDLVSQVLGWFKDST